MRPVTVAIVAVEDFSPFHFSVPCIMFSEKAATKKRFEVMICAEAPAWSPLRKAFPLPPARDLQR